MAFLVHGRFERHDGRGYGRDKIEFLSGSDGFGDLTIVQRASDVLIRYQGGSIRIEDDDAGNFAANDFLFT